MIPTPIRPLDLEHIADAARPVIHEPNTVCHGFTLARLAMPAGSTKALPEALFQFAAGLGETESLRLEARSVPSALRSFALTATARLSADASGCAPEGRIADLKEALSLTFPGLVATPLDEVPAEEATPDFAPITLRGLAVHVADLAGKIDAGLLAVPLREEKPSQHVRFGASTAESALSDALRIIAQSRRPLSLRLTLTSRRLSGPEVRQLSDLYRDLGDQRREGVLSGAEIARLSDVASLVATWLSAKSGVKLSVFVHADPEAGPTLASALGTAFSLPPSARRDAAAPALDLAGCFVCGQRVPALTLDPDAVRLLAPVRAATTRRDGEGSALLGHTPDDAPVRLEHLSRSRHLIVCGATGTGKSTLLKTLIASDVRSGHGVVLIDPHGDLFTDVLMELNLEPDIPVWIADTAERDAPYSLNLMEAAGDRYRQNFVCNQLIRLLKRSLYKDVPEGFGPMFEAYFRNAFLLLSDGGGGAYTISDMDRVFGDARFRRDLLETCSNEHVIRFWRTIATKAGGEAGLENIAPYIVSKLTQFVGNPVISPIVCAQESTIDFNRILDAGGVCVVNLAKGTVGTTEAEVLGGMFATSLFSAALARAGQARSTRRPMRVYLDEFQSYAGEVIAEMLAECRKYGLEMTLATQSLNRLRMMNGDLTQSVLGNAGNIVALRSGPQDADLLSDWIGGGITREDIVSLGDFCAIGRFLEEGRVTPPIAFRLGDGVST